VFKKQSQHTGEQDPPLLATGVRRLGTPDGTAIALFSDTCRASIQSRKGGSRLDRHSLVKRVAERVIVNAPKHSNVMAPIDHQSQALSYLFS
jgi:hypothetical protein